MKSRFVCTCLLATSLAAFAAQEEPVDSRFKPARLDPAMGDWQGTSGYVAQVVPTDNMGNTYTKLGPSHAYIPRWPSSGTALYSCASAVGGAGHVVTVGNHTDPTDEMTIAVVEVVNGGVVDWQWNETVTGAAMTSLPVTTTGPATLVAFWWGDADGTVAETAVPSAGFNVIDSVLAKGTLVQCAVATRDVAAAGTYTVSWTATPSQGAQLYLIAIQTGP